MAPTPTAANMAGASCKFMAYFTNQLAYALSRVKGKLTAAVTTPEEVG